MVLCQHIDNSLEFVQADTILSVFESGTVQQDAFFEEHLPTKSALVLKPQCDPPPQTNSSA